MASVAWAKLKTQRGHATHCISDPSHTATQYAYGKDMQHLTAMVTAAGGAIHLLLTKAA